MTSLVMEYPREDVRTLVKIAFEYTHGIKNYSDDGHRIIGKTGFSLGSYGENIIVEIPETKSDSEEVTINVRAEKEVEMNITASPEKYRSRFLSTLEELRGYPIDDIVEEMEEDGKRSDTSEVSNAENLPDGSSMIKWIVLATFIFTMIMMMMAV